MVREGSYVSASLMFLAAAVRLIFRKWVVSEWPLGASLHPGSLHPRAEQGERLQELPRVRACREQTESPKQLKSPFRSGTSQSLKPFHRCLLIWASPPTSRQSVISVDSDTGLGVTCASRLGSMRRTCIMQLRSALNPADSVLPLPPWVFWGFGTL